MVWELGEARRWYQALVDGIYRDEQAFERYGSKQRRTVRSDEAERRNLLIADRHADLSDRPLCLGAPRERHALAAVDHKPESVSKQAGQNDERGTRVDEQLCFFTPSRWSCQPCTNLQVPHVRIVDPRVTAGKRL